MKIKNTINLQANKLLEEYGRLQYTKQQIESALKDCKSKIDALNSALNLLPKEEIKNEQK